MMVEVEPFDAHIDDEDEDDVGAKSGLLPESLRKALVTGVSAVLMTEEGIRNAVSDMRLPKEAIGYLVQQTERSRKDLFQAISGELKGWLGNLDLTGELRKALTGLKLEIKAEVKFVDDTATDTSVQSKVTESGENDDGQATPAKKTKKKTRARKNKSKT